jgi:hypothetical protein
MVGRLGQNCSRAAGVFGHQHSATISSAKYKSLDGRTIESRFSHAERVYMTSCKGGGMFVGKWSVSVRNTTPCPVCRVPQPVRPYGGRYKIADHREPERDKYTPLAAES